MINYTTYHHEANPEVMVIEATGKMDTTAADFMLDCIQGFIDHGEKKFVIDCSELQMITSFGLGMLVRANSRLKENGGILAIAEAGGLVAETLRIVHFDRLFNLYSGVDEAATTI